MKTKLFAILNNAAASLGLASINRSLGFESPTGDSGVVWFPVARYGDYPIEALNLESGKKLQIIQRFDKKAAQDLKSHFDGLLNQATHFFRGIPILEGHIDDPSNPSQQIPAMGRVKEMEIREEGLWARALMNERGIPLIKGDAAPYSETSPFFWALDTGEKLNGIAITRPVALESIALVNKGNIPGNTIGLNNFQPETKNEPENNKTMIELKKLLGLPDDATDEDVIKAVTATLAKIKDTPTDQAALNTLKAKLKDAEKALAKEHEDKVAAALNAALDSKRIDEASKESWQAMLNGNYGAAKMALEAIVPMAAALNDKNAIGRVPIAKIEAPANRQAALNTAVKKYAAENGLDLSKTEDFDSAYDAVKAEVFAD